VYHSVEAIFLPVLHTNYERNALVQARKKLERLNLVLEIKYNMHLNITYIAEVLRKANFLILEMSSNS
jgi:hypothetical protein